MTDFIFCFGAERLYSDRSFQSTFRNKYIFESRKRANSNFNSLSLDLSAGVKAHPSVSHIQLAVHGEVQCFTPRHFSIQSGFPKKKSTGKQHLFEDVFLSVCFWMQSFKSVLNPAEASDARPSTRVHARKVNPCNGLDANML